MRCLKYLHNSIYYAIEQLPQHRDWFKLINEGYHDNCSTREI